MMIEKTRKSYIYIHIQDKTARTHEHIPKKEFLHIFDLCKRFASVFFFYILLFCWLFSNFTYFFFFAPFESCTRSQRVLSTFDKSKRLSMIQISLKRKCIFQKKKKFVFTIAFNPTRDRIQFVRASF